MDEGRKRTLAVVAAIFLCRKLAALDGRPSPARLMAFKESLNLAEELMRRIDERWPSNRIQSKDVNTPYK
jgi:transposase